MPAILALTKWDWELLPLEDGPEALQGQRPHKHIHGFLDPDVCHGGAHILVGKATRSTLSDSRTVGAGPDVCAWDTLLPAPS